VVSWHREPGIVALCFVEGILAYQVFGNLEVLELVLAPHNIWTVAIRERQAKGAVSRPRRAVIQHDFRNGVFDQATWTSKHEAVWERRTISRPGRCPCA